MRMTMGKDDMPEDGFDIRLVDLRKLNTVTKYPSIPTYHHRDASGGLRDEVQVTFSGEVIATEKIDGTSARIILVPDGTWLIGSRDLLLYAKDDIVGNPELGIVDALRPVAGKLAPSTVDGWIQVFYLELYGGGIGANARQYTRTSTVSYRLFDVATVDLRGGIIDRPVEELASWRDHGGQNFLSEEALQFAAAKAGMELTPRLFTIDGGDLPVEVEKMHSFLTERVPATTVGLDDTARGGAEGLVLRTWDRSVVAKARVASYVRTLKLRQPIDRP